MIAPALLPPVTDAHRRAAFARMHWVAWTFEAALKDDLRGRVLELRAAQIRTKEWLATHRRSVVPVHRCRPGLDGHPLKWCTQMAPGPLAPAVQDELLPNPDERAAP